MVNQETIIWTAIVFVLTVVLVAKTVKELRKDKKSHIIEFGTEEEIFYCPGDIKYNADKE